jgi:predicted amidohydrolase
MKIAAAQYPIGFFGNWDDWKKNVEKWVEKSEDADILIFPEFGSMELVSLFDEKVQKDLKSQILELNHLLPEFLAVFVKLTHVFTKIIICPSFPVFENGRFVNRVYVVGPNGLAGYQDKFFMTRFEDEEWGISSGTKKLSIFESNWGKFGIQTCYDVEFGIGSKLLCESGAEAIFAPSCTETLKGAARVHVGARARAMENQCYVAVSQTVGDALWSPAVDINYGYSAIYSTPDLGFPDEGILAIGEPQKKMWLFAKLEMEKIHEVRKNGSVLNFKSNSAIRNILTDSEIEIQYIRI